MQGASRNVQVRTLSLSKNHRVAKYNNVLKAILTPCKEEQNVYILNSLQRGYRCEIKEHEIWRKPVCGS